MHLCVGWRILNMVSLLQNMLFSAELLGQFLVFELIRASGATFTDHKAHDKDKNTRSKDDSADEQDRTGENPHCSYCRFSWNSWIDTREKGYQSEELQLLLRGGHSEHIAQLIDDLYILSEHAI